MLFSSLLYLLTAVFLRFLCVGVVLLFLVFSSMFKILHKNNFKKAKEMNVNLEKLSESWF